MYLVEFCCTVVHTEGVGRRRRAGKTIRMLHLPSLICDFAGAFLVSTCW